MPVLTSTRMRAAGRGCVLGVVLSAAMFACSPVQRHAVLDFVIDGVPPYMSPEERARRALMAEQRQAELIAEAPQRRRRQFRKLARFTHGPFAAQECTRCHDLTTSSGFRGLEGGAGGASSAVDLAEAGRLRMPVYELCVHCHTDYTDQTDESPEKAAPWLHGPVASGWCILCHDPHSSRYPYLLVLEPTARLCSRCHLREDLVLTAEHRPVRDEDGFPELPKQDPEKPEPEDAATSDASVARVVRDCTTCHNPHMGPDRLLLRPEDQWAELPGLRAGTDDPNVVRRKDQ